jgi:hypothetical protein
MASGDGQPVAGAAAVDVEPAGDAAAGRLAEISLAREDVLLVAGEVARRQEAAIEVARPFAARVLDQHAGGPQ